MMQKQYWLFVCLCLLNIQWLLAQSPFSYEISFPNAAHHEAKVQATFTNLEHLIFKLSMSRSSPGRYALHEFAKNIYEVKATDSEGNEISIHRPNPYDWYITGHDGTVNISYTLFANRGDGTYAQIDETHAHLNMPATFMYAPQYEDRPIEIDFKVREDLNWKVATQLKPLGDNKYFAPDIQYFMDSPTEISNYSIREHKQASSGKVYTIRFVLHHDGTEAEVDQYAEKVWKIVEQAQAVYGELPDFDYDTYTFLACYLPNVSGDGMEHRNSTILTSTLPLGEGGMKWNIGTVSHEFFHAWNVERLRPASLEPFKFDQANMSGELWFAEGFTSYYTNLLLCRARIISPQQYVSQLANGLNYVLNSPGRQYFNPIEMSYRAPFVDAATSIDPVNHQNIFISYYTYGSVLGLALDLSLRRMDKGLHLDGFMKLLWNKYGKPEIPYTIRDLENTLIEYAGQSFGQRFFEEYIYASNMPNYEELFASVGVNIAQPHMEKAYSGLNVEFKDKKATISTNFKQNEAAYLAGLEKGDELISINGTPMPRKEKKFTKLLESFKPGDKVPIIYERFGKRKSTTLTFQNTSFYETSLYEQENLEVSAKKKDRQDAWLGVEEMSKASKN